MAFEMTLASMKNPGQTFIQRSMYTDKSLCFITFIIRLAFGTIDTFSKCQGGACSGVCSLLASGTELYVALQTEGRRHRWYKSPSPLLPLWLWAGYLMWLRLMLYKIKNEGGVILSSWKQKTGPLEIISNAPNIWV